jgi:hypothetical protein
MMRTTINLDPDVLEQARTIARVERRSLGRVVSDLARRGLARSQREIVEEGGFPVFRVPPDAPPITSEHVRVALDES